MDTSRKHQYAKMLSENPLWDEIFKEMKQDLYEQFIIHTDMPTRERIAMAFDMLDDLQVKIMACIAEGANLTIVGDNNVSQ